MSESALVTQCLNAFSHRSFQVLDPKTHKTGVNYVLSDFDHKTQRGCVWRANTGALRAGRNLVRFGIAGCPDIIGFTSCGHWIGCEVKVQGGKLSDVQKAFHNAVMLCKGLIFVANGYQDCYMKLTELGY